MIHIESAPVDLCLQSLNYGGFCVLASVAWFLGALIGFSSVPSFFQECALFLCGSIQLSGV